MFALVNPWHVAQHVPHRVVTIDGRPTVWLEGPQMEPEEVVGESFYHAQLVRVTGGQPFEQEPMRVSAWLATEPHSPLYGPNAVAVWIGGGVVGYLQRERAAFWAPLLQVYGQRYGCLCACNATITGGGKAEDGKPMNYHVGLLLPKPPG